MQNKNIKITFILVTSLFLLWGLSYGLLDVMNKNFQTHLGITKANSGLLQAAYFGAYFIIAIPASLIASKYSYKVGIIVGLLLYAIGSLMIIPASNSANFDLFLLAFFILACGLGSLETNANPYITKLGSDKRASFRLNLAQSFNGVGQFIGPIIGGSLFLSLSHGNLDENMKNVQMVYVGIAAIVLFIMLLFIIIKMPEITNEDEKQQNSGGYKDLLNYKHFKIGVLAQFLYIAAQVGAGAFFINYSVEHWDTLSDANAAWYLSTALVAFMIGRVVTTPFMVKFSPNNVLGIYALINSIIILLLYVLSGPISVYALIAIFFFMSISFPTIFALSIVNIPSNLVKPASSILVMSIVGGAIMPFIMGKIADVTNQTAAGFLVLFPCFLFVAWYGFKGSKLN
ncbi:L-fucose:H+ symporter permease [Campylobacter fetus subsp. venerealis]|uniref:L-fucose:H+ symporter permease n=1 Tax=Campylobacter fetus TaxID=196 RepID=UPI0018E8F293|nr:L-fucose:H+ symporter permease [Campylobacter fetus]QQF51846.1 L-fucose:H+ symporter permease [Campylobacter fetus subsp. venerealis]